MNISLSPVSKKNKKTLAVLLFKYQKELFKKENIGMYKYLDSYWGRKDRSPFFIEYDSNRIGFVLVNKHTLVTNDARNIAEFYILKKFRNKRMGKNAAFKVFEMFPGKWEIREMENNINAQNFWRKIIGEYTNGKYSEVFLNNELWKGPVQIFDTLLK